MENVNLKNIILIHGKARHGKDTVADMFKEKFEKENKSFVIFHYGDVVKFWCSNYFGGAKDIFLKNEKNRTLWQQIGTDIARKNNPNVWVNIAIEFIKSFQNTFDYIIISDTRFPNEIDIIKEHFNNVVTIKVERLNFINDLTLEQQNHESEIALDHYTDWDYIIKSESGLDKLHKEFIKVFNAIERKK